MTFNHFEMHILCSKMLRQLLTILGADIFNWPERYRDDRNLFGIVMLLLSDATKGSPVIFDTGELMASFVAQNGELAMRDTQTIYGVVASRRANASNGVAVYGDTSHLLIS